MPGDSAHLWFIYSNTSEMLEMMVSMVICRPDHHVNKVSVTLVVAVLLVVAKKSQYSILLYSELLWAKRKTNGYLLVQVYVLAISCYIPSISNGSSSIYISKVYRQLGTFIK